MTPATTATTGTCPSSELHALGAAQGLTVTNAACAAGWGLATGTGAGGYGVAVFHDDSGQWKLINLDDGVGLRSRISDFNMPLSVFDQLASDLGITQGVAGGTPGSSSTPTLLQWSQPQAIDLANADATGGFAGISCPKKGFCVAVDSSGYAFVYQSGAWSSPEPADSVGFNTVSCATANLCEAGDQGGGVAVFDGSRWEGRTQVTPRETGNGAGQSGIIDISCPSASFCAAFGADGYLYFYRDGTWTGPQARPSDADYRFTAISCTSETFCLLTDTFSNAFTWDGTQWSDLASPPAAQQAISCASPQFCIGVEGIADAAEYQNGSWSSMPGVDSQGDLTNVSCPSTNFCIVIDTGGNAFTFNGRNWSAPTQVDPTGHTAYISCASTSFCAVVGKGDAVVGS